MRKAISESGSLIAPRVMSACTGPEDTFFQAVYETLLRPDSSGQLEADLATEWSYDDTLTTLTGTVRDHVTLTDEAELTAPHVNRTSSLGA